MAARIRCSKCEAESYYDGKTKIYCPTRYWAVVENLGGSDGYNKSPTIADAIQAQSREGGWVCPDCWNYAGGCRCKANRFIAFVGAYMKDCRAFDDKPKSPRR